MYARAERQQRDQLDAPVGAQLPETDRTGAAEDRRARGDVRFWRRRRAPPSSATLARGAATIWCSSGRPEPLRIDLDALDERLASPACANLARSLREAGFPRRVELLATYAGRPADFSEWLRGAAINRDRDLRLKYSRVWG